MGVILGMAMRPPGAMTEIVSIIHLSPLLPVALTPSNCSRSAEISCLIASARSKSSSFAADTLRLVSICIWFSISAVVSAANTKQHRFAFHS